MEFTFLWMQISKIKFSLFTLDVCKSEKFFLRDFPILSGDTLPRLAHSAMILIAWNHLVFSLRCARNEKRFSKLFNFTYAFKFDYRSGRKGWVMLTWWQLVYLKKENTKKSFHKFLFEFHTHDVENEKNQQMEISCAFSFNF